MGRRGRAARLPTLPQILCARSALKSTKAHLRPLGPTSAAFSYAIGLLGPRLLIGRHLEHHRARSSACGRALGTTRMADRRGLSLCRLWHPSVRIGHPQHRFPCQERSDVPSVPASSHSCSGACWRAPRVSAFSCWRVSMNSAPKKPWRQRPLRTPSGPQHG